MNNIHPRRGLSINLNSFGCNGAMEVALTGYELYRDLLFCLRPLPHISKEWHQPLPDFFRLLRPLTTLTASGRLLVRFQVLPLGFKCDLRVIAYFIKQQCITKKFKNLTLLRYCKQQCVPNKKEKKIQLKLLNWLIRCIIYWLRKDRNFTRWNK